MNVMIILMYNDYENALNLLKESKNYPSLAKIVVVDNCSPNGAYEIVKKEENEKVHVIKTDGNKGVAYGNNYGVKYAEKICPNIKNYIFSNPDVVINEQSIIDMERFLDENSEVGAVCPLEMTRENTIARDFAWKLPTYSQMLRSIMPIYINLKERSGKPYIWYYDRKELDKTDYFQAEVLIACFIMVRKSAYTDVGGFNEKTFIYHEENLFSYNLKKKGWKSYVLTKNRIIHLGCTSMKMTYSKWKERSDIVYGSSRIYLTECLKIKKPGMILYSMIYNIGTLERYLFRALKKGTKE